ncbi:MAG: hypothetical protein KF779_09315 [Hyphomonadaceae bacterium]|nr:hypothetical protein [Hyphomonadaceae bacterium]
MKQTILALALAALLAACGQGSAPDAAAPGSEVAAGACALVTDPDSVFGPNVQATAANDLPGTDGSCSWASADGLRNADLIHYTTQSLGGTTLDAQAATITDQWTQNGVTAQTLDEVGDSAQVAAGLVGDSAQAVVRKGDHLIVVVANSGDADLNSEAIVRQVATQAAAAL